ncbi:unknown protein [Seminavis robusta]|uniref:Uncharacterized protein n=1 Tax=Seminavis robusta TaxID=568900 RepID=A0A9N8HXJ2_9STRA|nr:unknown protein [Seminavis robusta]|eukprot:Sro2479_g328840.1 n/a (351) ;mRNA; f:8175-9227
MSNNNNNNDDDVDLLKIAELRLQLGNSEDDQENDESKQTRDDHDGGTSSRSPPAPSLAATAAVPPLPTSTTTSGFDIMKIVRERADAARLETAVGLELVELTEKVGTTQMGNNSCHDRITDNAQVPQPTILTKLPEFSRQQQMNPGAYAVDGPCLANDRENRSNTGSDTGSNTGSNTGTSEEGLNNWLEEIADDEIIAHPIDDDQQIGLLPNAEPLPTNRRSRQYWRQKLLCSLSVEINVAFFLVSIIVLILLATSKQGNKNQIPQKNGSIYTPPNPVEVATAQTFLESLNLPRYTLEALANSRSPQTKAYQWLVNNINNQTFTQPDLPKSRLIQRFAMATFFYSTRGDY